MNPSPFKVLFLCTANSARSILFAATLGHLGHGRFEAHSAGSQPAGVVNPNALAELARRSIAAAGARSKSWDEYSGSGASKFDLVITVCDNAANEACPLFFGDFIKAHWGLPDPASVTGDAETIASAFRITEDVVLARLKRLAALPVETLHPTALQDAFACIELAVPARPLQGVAA